jgi:hypothetical protein
MIRKDLKQPPQWDVLEFVDGYRAINAGSKVIVKDGVDWIRFYLIPTDELAKRYDISKDMLDENLAMEREYPKDMIITLNDDPIRKVKFCLLNFNGQLTPVSKLFIERMDAKPTIIIKLKEENNHLMAENAYLKEENMIAKTNPAKYIKENFSDIASAVMPLMREGMKQEEKQQEARK